MKHDPREASGSPALLRLPRYRRLWCGAVLYSLGQEMERLAVAWLVLDLSGSVFLTALAWALRHVPNVVFGPIAGALADRHPRNTVLAMNSLFRAAVVSAMAFAVLGGVEWVPAFLFLALLSGLTMPLQLAAAQPLAVEVAGIGRLNSAVTLLSFGQRLVGAAGALSGGFLIAWLGVGPTFALAAACVAGASGIYFGVHSGVHSQRAATRATRLSADIVEGLRLVAKVPIVRLLLILMVAVEILGFWFNSVLAVIAKDVFTVGPEGLGALQSAASVGSVLGTGLLAARAESAARGPVLLGVIACFGLLLLALASADRFEVGLLILALIGAVAGSVDALMWMLLQSSVDERMRGRVLGAWNLAIGWGWLGPVALGALSEQTGVAFALALSGALLCAVAALAASAKAIRDA